MRRVSAGAQPVGAQQERVLPRGERRAKDPERARPAQHRRRRSVRRRRLTWQRRARPLQRSRGLRAGRLAARGHLITTWSTSPSKTLVTSAAEVTSPCTTCRAHSRRARVTARNAHEAAGRPASDGSPRDGSPSLHAQHGHAVRRGARAHRTRETRRGLHRQVGGGQRLAGPRLSAAPGRHDDFVRRADQRADLVALPRRARRETVSAERSAAGERQSWWGMLWGTG